MNQIKEQVKHTPLPWKIFGKFVSCDYDLEHYQVAEGKGPNVQEQLANAEFIVKATNNFYELLGACKKGVLALEKVCQVNCVIDNRITDKIESMKQAIEQAEGKG